MNTKFKLSERKPMKYSITSPIVLILALNACTPTQVPHRDLPDSVASVKTPTVTVFTPDPLETCYSASRRHTHWFLPIGADEKVKGEHNHKGKSAHSHTHSSSAWCK